METKSKNIFLSDSTMDSSSSIVHLNASQKEFLNSIKYQLRLQSREPSLGPGGHPDPIIRNFYKAVRKKIYRKKYYAYRDLIVYVHWKRPSLNDTHFVNLWFRAIQCVLRRRGQSDYVHYTYANWKKYLSHSGFDDIPQVGQILISHNTATHLPARYRSFNNALRLITRNYHNLDLRIGDIGCSLGLGIKACLSNGFLSLPVFIDDTPGKQVINSFGQQIKKCSRAIGIDIQVPKVDWVKACNYPSRYDIDASALDSAIAKLSSIPFKVTIRQADILNPKTTKILTGKKQLTAIYSSMAMYELSAKDQQLARRNIAAALCNGGFFIEFTFINPNNWFKGIHTIVRVNHHGKLSSPLIWHVWQDSRCSHVRAGKDFNQVQELLINFGSKL